MSVLGSAAPRAAAIPARRTAVTAWLVLAGLILAAFHDTAISLVQVWSSSATYGHGFLIVPICGYLVWRRRRLLPGLALRPAVAGQLAVLAGALVWLAGDLSQVRAAQHLGLIVMLQASVPALLGWAATRALSFPIAYLLLAVPFGDFAVPPLQTLTADWTVVLLRATGIPVYMENWRLQIPGGHFLVAEACAGVRYLLVCIALAILTWDLMLRAWWRRLLFLALSVIVPILANVVRAYGIVMLAHLSDFEIAVDVDHLIYGGVFLTFVTVLLIALAVWLRDMPAAPHAAGPPAAAVAASGRPAGGAGAFVLALVAVAALLAGVRGYGGWAEARAAVPVHAVVEVPERLGAWRQQTPAAGGWSGDFPRADQQRVWSYRNGSREVRLFVAYYTHERPGAELVTFANSLLGDPDASVEHKYRPAEFGSDKLPAPQALRIRGPREPLGRIVWTWYRTGGQVLADPIAVKRTTLTSALLGRSTAGLAIAVSTPAGPDAHRDLAEIVGQLERFDRIRVRPIAPVQPDLGG